MDVIFLRSRGRRPVRLRPLRAGEDSQGAAPLGWCRVCGKEIFTPGRALCPGCGKEAVCYDREPLQRLYPGKGPGNV